MASFFEVRGGFMRAEQLGKIPEMLFLHPITYVECNFPEALCCGLRLWLLKTNR